MNLTLLVVVVVLAAAAAFLLGRSGAARAAESSRAGERLEGERRYAELARSAAADTAAAQARAEALGAQLADSGKREQELREQLRQSGDRLREAELESTRAKSALDAERAAGTVQQDFFKTTRADLSHYFEKVAAEILEDKSKRFTEHNRANLEQLLGPLREKLGEFGQRVETLQSETVKGQGELRGHIETLRGLNEKLSTDANNLVKALKNSSKQQGDWGEVLLVGMLESAGLRAGAEYRLQESFATEEGRHVRPDIILNLPDEKHLVIDSKVSLVSYADYCACEDEASRKGLLERHARSVRDHVDGLSKKSYQQLHQLRSLDFVVMFVPIEAAYLLALAHDEALWQRAWSRDVLLVSPGTLFPVIRTIAHIWQQERQTRNVEQIVREGGALYDKVALFAASFEDVGRKIAGARTAYEKAFGQLASGRGHVLSRIENLRKLGVHATKQMPRGMAEITPEELLGEPGAETDVAAADAERG